VTGKTLATITWEEEGQEYKGFVALKVQTQCLLVLLVKVGW
jgi:hypothetical protein